MEVNYIALCSKENNLKMKDIIDNTLFKSGRPYIYCVLRNILGINQTGNVKSFNIISNRIQLMAVLRGFRNVKRPETVDEKYIE